MPRLDNEAVKFARPALGYFDFHEHLEALEASNLLLKIDHPVNKDTELHPLVRWQFRGGLAEHERKAFLFTNVIDGLGRHYEIPLVVGGSPPTPRSIASAWMYL